MTCNNLSCSYTPPQGCQQCPPPGVCPDLVIRRHDVRPPLKVSVEDCDGPMDLTGLVLEATMWAKGRFKKIIHPADNYFALADNIGFEQIMVGDIIVVDRPRSPEKMLVVGFDEVNYLVEVERGHAGTTPQVWRKGTRVRIIKFWGASGQTHMVYQDVIQVDGTTANQLTDSLLVYEWGPTDTCLPGCYFLEFKLLKMVDTIPVPVVVPDDEDDIKYELVGPPKPYVVGGPYPSGSVFGPFGPYAMPGSEEDIAVNGIHGTDNFPTAPRNTPDPDQEVLEGEYSKVSMMNSVMALAASPSVTPSFTRLGLTPADYSCGLGVGVEWVRRFPVNSEGFLVQVTDSPTAEL